MYSIIVLKIFIYRITSPLIQHFSTISFFIDTITGTNLSNRILTILMFLRIVRTFRIFLTDGRDGRYLFKEAATQLFFVQQPQQD